MKEPLFNKGPHVTFYQYTGFSFRNFGLKQTRDKLGLKQPCWRLVAAGPVDARCCKARRSAAIPGMVEASNRPEASQASNNP